MHGYLSFTACVAIASATFAIKKDQASLQLQHFKEKTHIPIGLLTTSWGTPIGFHEATSTLHSNLLRHSFFMDSITHLDRERIPERFVHARGNGAFGHFEVTHDISHICKAKLFSEVGKKTQIAVRFSQVAGERGTADTTRDIRGFAVKFYTEEGNFDIVGLNSPTFVVKDPLFFTSFVHAQKPNPTNNIIDFNMRWDYFILRPESAILMLTLLSDRGTPDGYRHLPGFGIHTFQVVNDYGDPHFVRFHFIPDAGIKNLKSDDATTLAGQDPDYASRDLYNAIENGQYPSWTLAVQVLSLDDVKRLRYDPFDPTRYLPTTDFPLHQVGRFVLNKNPSNYFAEMEQLAFNPGNLVPGILGGPDKLYEGRLLSYRDAQHYRLGVNHNKITVNCPIGRPLTYNRDGQAPVKDNENDTPNYFPNSFNGAAPYIEKAAPKILEVIQHDTHDIEQARHYYLHELTKQERKTLPGNVISTLTSTTKNIQEKAIKLFFMIDHTLGSQIALGLKINSTGQFFSNLF